MFFKCSSLKSLDLSSFNTINVDWREGISGIFSGCSCLKKENIKIKNSETILLKELEKLNDYTNLDKSCH